MNTTTLSLPEIYLMGIKTRTNNYNEFKPELAKIGACLEKYFSNEIFNTIPNRKYPGKTICVYTEYESDETGEYTYFVGEEVTTIEETAGLETLIIPTQHYLKITTPSGQLPNIVIDAWQQIWEKNNSNLNVPRRYLADFEVYDARASDPDNSVVDIYLGIQNPTE